MSGFGYLVSEIVLCLLLAAALGFLIGWLWRALLADRKEEEANRDWSGRLERTEAKYRDLDDKLRAAEEEHAKARDEYDKSIAALNADLEGRASLDASSKEQGEAQEARQALEDELDSLRGQLAECQEANANSQAELDTLRGDLAASQEADAGEGEDEDAQLLALQATVEEQTRLHDEATARVADLEKELAACQQAQSDEGATSAAPLMAAAVAAGAATDDLEAQLAEKDQQIHQLEQQLAAMDKLAGESLEPDDLQRIRGIGPVLERMLNGVGVFTFRQIAAWDAADIAWAAAKLDAFTDRIERDEWVIQAREFYRAKLDGES